MAITYTHAGKDGKRSAQFPKVRDLIQLWTSGMSVRTRNAWCEGRRCAAKVYNVGEEVAEDLLCVTGTLTSLLAVQVSSGRPRWLGWLFSISKM